MAANMLFGPFECEEAWIAIIQCGVWLRKLAGVTFVYAMTGVTPSGDIMNLLPVI